MANTLPTCCAPCQSHGDRMVAVLQAARDGVDLESGPLPVGTLPLTEALAAIELYQTKGT